MRVVLYNFVQPDDPTPGKQGGGVAIYQRNLAKALRAAGHEVVNLDSGDRYDVFRTEPRLEVGGRGGRLQAHIVNSPVFAPSHAAFHGIATYDSGALDGMATDLREKLGDVDVFHFQNVEGLTHRFFHALRSEFPQARILLSAHNYSLICPQVNLWFREHKVCGDYRDGRACVNCLLSPDHHLFEPNQRRIDSLLGRFGIKRYSRLGSALQLALRGLFYAERRMRKAPSPVRLKAVEEKRDGVRLVDDGRAEAYANYRLGGIALCDEVFDRVLAVSQRTRQVLVDRGAPADRISVSYIGTAHKQHFDEAERRLDVGEGLHAAYLGYMRQDKGFYFLLESLFALPDEVAATIALTIAAPIRDMAPVERLRGMAHRFREIRIFDGYSHANLDRVLDGVNLGLVPVLWEDNLPQVAIEMVSRGIPLLTSDRGGAREIAGHPDFVFEAGSTRDFVRKIVRLARGGVSLSQYWRSPTRIFSMEEHIDDLMTHYDQDIDCRSGAAQPPEPRLRRPA